MQTDDIRVILNNVADGKLKPDAALDRLKHLPFEDIGFARVDHHRSLRSGSAEVIYCPGKTAMQVVTISAALIKAGSDVLATRADRPVFNAVKRRWRSTPFAELGLVCSQRSPSCSLPGCHSRSATMKIDWSVWSWLTTASMRACSQEGSPPRPRSCGWRPAPSS